MSYAGTARYKRNSWMRGNGANSMRGELRRGISMRKKVLNRKVRRASRLDVRHSGYKKVCPTLKMVDFT